MNIQHLNTFLILFLIGVLSALFHCYILKKHFAGRLWSAILVGLMGSFLGHFLSSLPLWQDFQWIKIFALFAALIVAQVLLFLLGALSSLKDY